MAKRKTKKRARPRTKRTASRARRTVTKTKSRTMERWFLVIVSVVIIVAIILSIPSVNLNGIVPQQQGGEQEQQTSSEITTTYPCKSNLDCFLISCRDTSSIEDCVNAVTTETYGSDVCGSYSKVTVPYHDSTRCSCVQGLCKLIR